MFFVYLPFFVSYIVLYSEVWGLCFVVLGFCLVLVLFARVCYIYYLVYVLFLFGVSDHSVRD